MQFQSVNSTVLKVDVGPVVIHRFFLVCLERIEHLRTHTKKRNQHGCCKHPPGAHAAPELVQVERITEQDGCCKQTARSDEH